MFDFSYGYDFSGDKKQLAQDMADLGFVDNSPMTNEALTSKYTRFLNNLYGVPEIGGSIQGGSIPGVDNRVDFLGRVTEPSYVDPMPTPPMIAPPGIGIRPPRFPSTSTPQAGVVPGIEALMPAEEEGYKKYIASDTNPFESMGISSLGQDALKQMIFERNNPQANQSRGYKSYIG